MAVLSSVLGFRIGRRMRRWRVFVLNAFNGCLLLPILLAETDAVYMGQFCGCNFGVDFGGQSIWGLLGDMFRGSILGIDYLGNIAREHFGEPFWGTASLGG